MRQHLMRELVDSVQLVNKTLSEEFYERLRDESLSIFSLTTEEMRKVNAILRELLGNTHQNK
jgi:hypothetical protein